MVSLCGRKSIQMDEISFEFGEAPEFSYSSLQIATNFFSDNNLIQDNGFAKVYRGVLPNGTLIAVRKYHRETIEQLQLQLQRTVEVLSCVRHPNIARLIGHCIHKNQWLLVSERFGNGSLRNLLDNKEKRDPTKKKIKKINKEKRESVFNWPMRVAVCKGIARGIYHLHEQTSPCVIHRDINPANILFDSNFTPKIIGFDLAMFVNKFHGSPLEEEGGVDDMVMGTSGYTDPEYLQTSKCKTKSDVYGFGVVMLEIISGRKTFFHYGKGILNLSEWALDLRANDRVSEIVDPALADFPMDQVLSFIDVAFSCIERESRLRPSMGEVIQMLDGVCNPRKQPLTLFEMQPNNCDTPYLSAASSFRSSTAQTYNEGEGESSIVESEETELQAQEEIEETATNSNTITIATQQQNMRFAVSGSGDLVERLSQPMVFERSTVNQGEFAAYRRKKNMMPRNKA